MHIAVVIVNWNGLHLLQPCITALEAQTQPFELIVVDNGSTDGSAAWIERSAPYVTLIKTTDNLGFAKANNIGIRHSRSDAVILINNDMLPPPSFVEDLVQPLQQDQSAGVSAGVMVFAHRPDIIASAGIVPGKDGVHRDLYALQPVSTLSAQPHTIFGASGGAVCFRREALDDVGVFDAGYGTYLEDADLAWRLRLRGWKTVLSPQARIPHIYSATAGHASPRKQLLLARNRMRVLLRCWPGKLLRRHATSILRYDLLAITYGLMTRQYNLVKGRLGALNDLRSILDQRAILQGNAIIGSEELTQWLGPALSVRAVMDEGKRLDRILREREVTQ